MNASEIPVVEAQVRERLGTRDAARLREAGRMPAVIYGQKKDPVHVSVDAHEVLDAVRHAQLIDIKAGDHSDHCLVKDIQWDYLGDTVLHLDLERVDLNQRVTVEVEIELTGEAVGLKEAGAILEQMTHKLSVSCLATNIPETVELDISELEVGQTLSASDAKLPSGMELDDDADKAICGIQVAAEIEEDDEAADADGQPEVIGEKADEGGEG